MKSVAGLALIVAVVLTSAVIATWQLRQRDNDAVAQCDPSTTLGALPSDDIRLSPFSSDSPWKQPVTVQPTAANQTSMLTLALHAIVNPGVDGGAPFPIRSWINAEEFSMPVVQAGPCDPFVSFVEDAPLKPVPAGSYQVPAGAPPAAGEDRHLLVIQPDGYTMVEMFAAEQVSPDTWKAGRVEIVDLRGDGIGPDNGVRAYGGSALGGLIRDWEIDPTDPSYTDGVIRHPLAMALPSSMLRYDGGDPGYDSGGYGTALGYVAPATEQDYDSPWTYSGVIPMGSRVVLPRSVDIGSLQLGPEATTIAHALQDYGAFVTDRTAPDTVSFYAEPTAPRSWLDAVRGPDDTGGQLDRIRAQLVVLHPT